MFIDTARIQGNSLATHRSSFLLDRITAADVQRPLLSISAIPATGACAFCVAFADILYTGEIVAVVCVVAIALMAGASVGQLKLVSSDLRGSDVSGAIWGSYRHLQDIHSQINTVWTPKEATNGTL